MSFTVAIARPEIEAGGVWLARTSVDRSDVDLVSARPDGMTLVSIGAMRKARRRGHAMIDEMMPRCLPSCDEVIVPVERPADPKNKQ